MPLSQTQESALAEMELRLQRGEMPTVASPPSTATPAGQFTMGDSLFGQVSDDWQLMDIARALINVPGSAMNVAGDIASAVSSPIDTAKALGSVGYGAILAGAEAISGESEGNEEYKAAFKHFINAMSERYGGIDQIHQTMVNDPVGFLLDISPAKTGLAKMGLKGAGKLNVGAVGGTSRIMEMMGKTGANIAEEVAPNVMSMSTGIAPETFRTGVSAGAKNVREVLTGGRSKRKLDADSGEQMTELESFNRAMTEQKKGKQGRDPFEITELSNAVDEAAQAVQSRASDKIGPAKAALSGKEADIAGLIDKLDDYASDTWGVKWQNGKLEAVRSSGVPGLPVRQQQFLKNVFAELDQHRGKSDLLDFDLYDLHNTLVAIDGMAPASVGRFKVGNAAWAGARDIARKHLEDIDIDWAKHSEAYSKDMSILRDIAMTFGESGSNPTTRISKILRTMSENPSSDFMRDISRIVSDRSGYHLAQAAAGSALSQWIPSGIHGKAVAFGAVSGGVFSPAIFLALPATIPRLMGNLATKLGVPAAAARKIEKWGLALREKLPADWIDSGLNVGTIVTRMLEEGREVPPFPDFSSTEERLKKGIK